MLEVARKETFSLAVGGENFGTLGDKLLDSQVLDVTEPCSSYLPGPGDLASTHHTTEYWVRRIV